MPNIDTIGQIEENDQTLLENHPENQITEPDFAPDFDGLWLDIQAEFDQVQDLQRTFPN